MLVSLLARRMLCRFDQYRAVAIDAFLLARASSSTIPAPDALALHEAFARLLAELPADMPSTPKSAAAASANGAGSSSGSYVQDIAPQVLRARFVMQNWAQPSFSRVRGSYECILQKYPAVRTQCKWVDAAESQAQQARNTSKQ